MPYVFNKSTVIKCFGLIFDGISAKDASDIMQDLPEPSGKFPGNKTIEKWARDGELTDGVSWYSIRDTCSALRTNIQVHEQLFRNSPKEYNQFIEDTASDVDTLQNLMMTNLKKMRFSVADLAHLTKTRLVLEDASGQRQNQAREMTRIMGEIVKQTILIAASLYPASQEVRDVLASISSNISDEFLKYISEGCPVNYEPTVGHGTKSGRRVLARD